MKKQLTIMITCMLFLTLYISGCEQLFNKSDSVKVNVMVAVFVNAVDENYTPVNISFTGMEVKINLSKNGKDNLSFERLIQNNLCRVTCTYTLAQGESIECLATIPNGFNNYYPINTGNATLTWKVAQANMDYTGLYNWYPNITIIMMQNSTK
ncbi:Uncharacterised protein [uncultured archaeon]|nr:Uncharacterised protein [uncultured archaeon]